MKNVRLFLISAATLMLAGAAFAQPPAMQKTIEFNLSAQPLGDALNRLAEQSGLRIVFYAQAAKGMVSPPMAGQYTPEAALKMLLKGSALEYRFVDENTVEIHGPQTPPSSAAVPAPAVAQLAMALQKVVEEPQPQATNETESAKGIPEILVKGSRTLNMDIQRTRDDVQPYVIFDRTTIERSGATNLEDFFKTRLTMNTTQTNNDQIAGGFRGNQSSINLRGLGANQTLILVDGRRMAGVYASGVEQPDINGISLASIERIEVLPSTASGIYGGSATGGVINIILRRDYRGVESKLTYENTTGSDAAVRRVDLNAGFSLEGGKTQLLLSGSYSDGNPLRVEERDFVQRARALMLANNANNYALFNSGTSPPRGATTNIRSVNGSNLELKSSLGGTNLGSSITYLPANYAGSAADMAGLVANAGRYDLQLANDYTSRKSAFISNPRIESMALNVRRPFGAHVQAFLDASVAENHSITPYLGLAGTSATLSNTAPNNPFTTPIRVTFPLTSLAGESYSDTTQRRAAGGVIVQLPRQWTAGADYTWNRSHKYYEAWGPMTAAGTAALADGTLNVMRDLNVYPLQYLPNHLNPPGNTTLGPFRYTVRNASVRLAGPVLSMPGGPIALSALFERREEGLAQSINIAASGSATIYPARTQDVNSAYVEARLPLVSPRNALRFVRQLEGQLSLRRDEYETNGVTDTVSNLTDPLVRATNKVNSTDITVGLRYSPTDDIVLRVSYGTGFLPPSLNQIIPSSPFNANVTDPRRGNTAGSVVFTSGGNPNLVPEESKSGSAGVILTPRSLPGLRLSIDYTRIEKNNEIAGIGVAQMLDLEDVLVGRITRAASCPGDPYAPICPIVAIDARTTNITEARVDAYDVQLDYRLADLGSFGAVDFFAVTTWQTHLLRRFLFGGDFVENVGFDAGVLRFKGNAGFTWQRGNWTAGWTTRYIDSYRAYTSTAAPATIATVVRNQGSDTIPHRYYHDLFAQYGFDRTGWLSNTDIGLTVRNVFDTEPPILASTSASAGGYSTYSDPRLRFYSLSLKKSFQ